MEDHLSRLESRLDALTRSVHEVEQRLSSLEADSGSSKPVPYSADETAESEETGEKPRELAAVLAQAGRFLIILAGAFLLRAITDAGYLPRVAGTVVGLLYALVWIVAAHVFSRRGSRPTAQALGLAATMVVFPLLSETTARYGILSPTVSALVLAGVVALFLGVAGAHRLRSVAWMVVLLATGTAAVLGMGKGPLFPYAVMILFLCWSCLLLSYWRGWWPLTWLSTLVVDGFLALLIGLILFGEGSKAAASLTPESVLALLLAMILLYVGSFGSRTLIGGRDIGAFEILQTFGALVVGLGGAVVLTRVSGISTVPLGVVCLLVAIGGYGAAFSFVDRHRRKNFLYFTTLALILVVVAGNALLSLESRAIVFAAAALLLAWLGGRYARMTLNVHSAFYVVTAAIVSGLVGGAVSAFLGDVPAMQSWSRASMLLTLAAAAVATGMPVPTHVTTWGPLSHVPKILLLLVLVLGLGGIVVSGVCALVVGAREDMGLVSALRTLILALSTVFLAIAGGLERTKEARWLVYPVLIAAGLKFVIQDIPTGRPTTLVISLTSLGVSLILAPRISRRLQAASVSPEGETG